MQQTVHYLCVVNQHVVVCHCAYYIDYVNLCLVRLWLYYLVY